LNRMDIDLVVGHEQLSRLIGVEPNARQAQAKTLVGSSVPRVR
jgi:hypothetical protein